MDSSLIEAQKEKYSKCIFVITSFFRLHCTGLLIEEYIDRFEGVPFETWNVFVASCAPPTSCQLALIKNTRRDMTEWGHIIDSNNLLSQPLLSTISQPALSYLQRGPLHEDEFCKMLKQAREKMLSSIKSLFWRKSMFHPKPNFSLHKERVNFPFNNQPEVSGCISTRLS